MRCSEGNLDLNVVGPQVDEAEGTVHTSLDIPVKDNNRVSSRAALRLLTGQRDTALILLFLQTSASGDGDPNQNS